MSCAYFLCRSIRHHSDGDHRQQASDYTDTLEDDLDDGYKHLHGDFSQSISRRVKSQPGLPLDLDFLQGRLDKATVNRYRLVGVLANRLIRLVHGQDEDSVGQFLNLRAGIAGCGRNQVIQVAGFHNCLG
jgi:hypothetical protein